jgi:hypothetical protein
MRRGIRRALTVDRSTHRVRIVGGAVNRGPAKRTRERKLHESYHDFSETDFSEGSAAVPHRRHCAASAEPHYLQNLRPHGFQRRTLRTAPVTSLVTKSPQSRQSATQRTASNLRKERHADFPWSNRRDIWKRLAALGALSQAWSQSESCRDMNFPDPLAG